MSDVERLGLPDTLPRTFNRRGRLKSLVGDLQGYATLAGELVQNADDARGASKITFDVRHNALIVDNNGRFRGLP